MCQEGPGVEWSSGIPTEGQLPPGSGEWLPCRKMRTVSPNLLIIQEIWEIWIIGTVSQLFLLLARKANNTFFLRSEWAKQNMFMGRPFCNLSVACH